MRNQKNINNLKMKSNLERLIRDSCQEITDAYVLASQGYQAEVTIKILPDGKIFFFNLNKSRKINTAEETS